MEDRSQPSNPTDIAAEKYRGPSAQAAALGNGVILHLIGVVSGLLAVGLYAYFDHGRVARNIDGMRNWAEKLAAKNGAGTFLSETGARIQRIGGSAIFSIFGEGEHIKSIKIEPKNLRHVDWVHTTLSNKQHGFGFSFLSHTFGLLPVLGKPIKNALITISKNDERLANAITFGGAGGLVGYVAGWPLGLLQGAKGVTESKDQFERAQDEILTLRAQQNDTATHEETIPAAHASSEKTGPVNGEAPTPTHPVTTPPPQPTHAASHAHALALPTVDASSIAHAGMQQTHAHQHAAS